MKKEITVSGRYGFLLPFARLVGGKAKNGLVQVPSKSGVGYIRGVYISPDISLMIRNYELNDDLLVKRTANASSDDVVVFSFQNVFDSVTESSVKKRKKRTPATQLPLVRVFSAGIASEMLLPASTWEKSITIAVTAAHLRHLINGDTGSAIFNAILSNRENFVFEELISPLIQKAANELVSGEIPLSLQAFYYRAKAEELICYLLLELLKRDDDHVQSLNAADVKAIYAVKEKIAQQIDTPPVLGELASFARMSESKLKRLFKQVFGNSIYSYYQGMRMNRAAALLREGQLSVSETGYQLGFSNLSHFSRLFETHIGMKPKKYSRKRAGNV